MLKPTLAFLSLAIVLASPASAQQSLPPTTQPGAGLVGLPIYSSDGQMLGQVTPSTVLIDAEVFQRKADRIELTMTAAEVKEKISTQGAQPNQRRPQQNVPRKE
jgi:hypothetical protein